MMTPTRTDIQRLADDLRRAHRRLVAALNDDRATPHTYAEAVRDAAGRARRVVELGTSKEPA